MIDIHSHVLPEIDDGSRNLQMSLAMLQLSKEQGVEVMFLTPHFYASENDPETFLRRRTESALRLQDQINARPNIYPKCILGAEVYYYRGMGHTEAMESLCMGNSRYILLEPPFHKWTDSFLEDVRLLRDEQNLKIIIAHIERYFDQNQVILQELLQEPEVYIQSNAESFLHTWRRRKPLKLLKNGHIDFLGSDSHNLQSRSPNLAEGRAMIQAKLGTDSLRRIDRNSTRLVAEAQAITRESL